MQFSQLGLSPSLLRVLTKEGYETPTPIQAQAIPHVLEGKDLLGCAQTGTGKTAAFALPILQRLMTMPVDKTRRGPAKARALILSPTRELAIQIRDSFRTYGAETGIRSTVIFGGVSQLRQVQALRDGVDIIIATPGRLLDLMEQRKAHLDDVQILVLDEADRMLDMGFIQPIRLIASKTPAERQTLFFSATMPPEIQKLASTLLRDPVKIAVTPVASAAPKTVQSLYHVDRAQKQALLTLMLADQAMDRVVVFTKTKHGADKVGYKLERAGVRTETIHGNKAQNARKKALDKFRAGQARVLVATDVAARGLDVDGITHVVNFDLPMEPEAYVHRIGRTGRAGATGIAISFCDREERGLLRDIERLLKNKIPLSETPFIERAPAEAADSRSDDRFSDRPRERAYAGGGGGNGGGGGGSRSQFEAHPETRSDSRPARPASRPASRGATASGTTGGKHRNSQSNGAGSVHSGAESNGYGGGRSGGRPGGRPAPRSEGPRSEGSYGARAGAKPTSGKPTGARSNGPRPGGKPAGKPTGRPTGKPASPKRSA